MAHQLVLQHEGACYSEPYSQAKCASWWRAHPEWADEQELVDRMTIRQMILVSADCPVDLLERRHRILAYLFEQIDAGELTSESIKHRVDEDRYAIALSLRPALR